MENKVYVKQTLKYAPKGRQEGNV